MEYIMLKYRERFHLSPKQFDEEVDLITFIKDQQMFTLEQEANKLKTLPE